MGLALLNVVDDNDGGEGPNLEHTKYQRPLSKKQLRNLEIIAQEDGSGLLTQHFENAIYVAVEPALLDSASLTTSIYGPFKRVAWQPHAKSTSMILLAGAHRRQTSINLTAPHRKAITVAQKQIQRLNASRSSGRQVELQQNIQKLQEAVESKSVWLTVFYDQCKMIPRRYTMPPLTCCSQDTRNA